MSTPLNRFRCVNAKWGIIDFPSRVDFDYVPLTFSAIGWIQPRVLNGSVFILFMIQDSKINSPILTKYQT